VSGTPTVGAMSAERRDALIVELDWLERRALSGVDGSGAPSDDELAALGRRLAAWIRRDDTFADQLVELSVSNMLIARLLGHARFPSSFAAAVVRRMAAPNGPDTGVDHDRYAASLSIALSSLADDPTACLDLLLDEPTAHALASWQALDTAMLADFVVSGLHGAIAVDPARLDDGYGVLRFLTRAANGPLDGGMSAGMAVGVASSLAGYIDTLAPGIRQEGSTPVTVRAVDPPLELGSYDDLVDLFGSLLRVPEAQAALGTVLAAYTFETFERIGGDAARRPDPTYVAQFADLIGDASRTEQVELVMAAAAEEARRRRLGGLVGFGVNATLLLTGAGSVARSVAGQAVRMATSWAARVEPERFGRLPDPGAHLRSDHGGGGRCRGVGSVRSACRRSRRRHIGAVVARAHALAHDRAPRRPPRADDSGRRSRPLDRDQRAGARRLPAGHPLDARHARTHRRAQRRRHGLNPRPSPSRSDSPGTRGCPTPDRGSLVRCNSR
jgi:hypothetical protein